MDRLHSVFPYPARMKPYLVEEIMERFPGKYYDPFGGSGTIPVQAYVHGYDAVAVDLLPTLPLYTWAKIDLLERRVDLDSLYRELISLEPQECSYPWLDKFWTGEFKGYACSLTEYVRGKSRTNGCSVETEEPVAVLTALWLARAISLADNFSYHWSRSRKRTEQVRKILESVGARRYYERKLRQKIEAMKRIVKDLPRPKGSSVTVYGCTDSGTFKTEADVVLTSPPYLRAISYTRALRYEMKMLGIENVPSPHHTCQTSLLGDYMERVGDKRRFLLSYICMMTKVFENVEADTVVIVVGNATLNGVVVPLDSLFKSILESSCMLIEEKVYPIKNRKIPKGRNNPNKEGIKTEKLLIFRKRSGRCCE